MTKSPKRITAFPMIISNGEPNWQVGGEWWPASAVPAVMLHDPSAEYVRVDPAALITPEEAAEFLNRLAVEGWSLRWLQELRGKLLPEAIEMLETLVKDTLP